MTELEETVALANRVIDRPNADPDGDLCMLARQFLRGLEREDKLRKALSDADTLVLDALNLFHPMHGESWKGWPEGSE